MSGEPRKTTKPATKKQERPIVSAFVELLKVRSIITIVIIGVMSYLAVEQIIDAATFMTLAGAVVTYYFNRKEQ